MKAVFADPRTVGCSAREERPGPLSFTVTLPALSTNQAITLWETLHRVADVLWDAYGVEMSEVFIQEASMEDLHDNDPESSPHDQDSSDDVPF